MNTNIVSRDEVADPLHERRSVSHEGGVGAGKLRNDATLSQRRRLWMLRWARRVDVLHGAAEQAVKLPVGRDPVQQTALTVPIAVWDPVRMLLGVDDVLSRDVDGAGLPPVRPASPLLLLPRMLLLVLIQVGLLCLGDLAHQSWYPCGLRLALHRAQQGRGG